MCLAGAVVAIWIQMQEIKASSSFTVITNIFVTECADFSETFRKNSITSKCTWENGRFNLWLHARWLSDRQYVDNINIKLLSWLSK